MQEKDREAFLDVMEIMYRLPTKEGTEIYGREYKVIGQKPSLGRVFSALFLGLISRSHFSVSFLSLNLSGSLI